jgi:hypothetical protein
MLTYDAPVAHLAVGRSLRRAGRYSAALGQFETALEHEFATEGTRAWRCATGRSAFGHDVEVADLRDQVLAAMPRALEPAYPRRRLTARGGDANERPDEGRGARRRARYGTRL